MKNLYTIKTFADETRKKFPGVFDNLDDTFVTTTIVNQYPQYKNIISEYTGVAPEPEEKPIDAIKEPSIKPQKTAQQPLIDPDVKAERNFLAGTINTLRETVQQVPSFAFGAASKALEFGEEFFYTPRKFLPMIVGDQAKEQLKREQYNKLKEISEMGIDPETGENLEWKDRFLSDVLQDVSEDWRKWGEKSSEDYIRNHPDVQAHLLWTQSPEAEFSKENFLKTPFTLLGRGMSEMAPSWGLTLAAGLASAPLAIATGIALEGSSSYNQAMKYLTEEKGLDVDTANDLAATTSSLYGAVAGVLEKFQVDSVLRGAGLSKAAGKGLYDKMIDVAVRKAGVEGGQENLNRAVKGLIKSPQFISGIAIEGVQEWSQETSQQVISNIYEKYSDDLGNVDFNEYAKNFRKDLVEAASSDQAKDAFFSAFTGSLGFKAAGRSVKGLGSSYRFSRDYIAGKRKATEAEKAEEGGEFSDEIPKSAFDQEDVSAVQEDPSLRRDDDVLLGMSLLSNLDVVKPTEVEQEIINNENIGFAEEDADLFVNQAKNNPKRFKEILKEINPTLKNNQWLKELGKSETFTADQLSEFNKILKTVDTKVKPEVKKKPEPPVSKQGKLFNEFSYTVEEVDDDGTGFQSIRKGVSIADNRQLANKISNRLKKQFPWVEARELEQVFDEKGNEVAGKAFKNIVEWSKTKATLDTMPHEYGHVYIKMMKKSKTVQEGIKRFGSEEKLVQHMGDYYANRMQDKGLLSRFKTWLRKFRVEAKNFFGKSLSEQDTGDLIAGRFFSARVKKAPKVFSPVVDYQRVDTNEDEQSEAPDKQDNDFAQDAIETDVRESTQKIYNKFLRSIEVTDIEISKLAGLQQAARELSFDQWLTAGVKTFLNKDVDLSNKEIERFGKRFYHTIKSQGKTFSDNIEDDMYHNMQLELTKEITEERDDLGNRIIKSELNFNAPESRFFRVTSQVKKYYTSDKPKIESGRKYTTRFLADENPAVKSLLKDTYLLRKENLYEHNITKHGDRRVLSNPYSFLRFNDVAAIIKSESERFKKNPKSGFRKFPVFSKDGINLYFQEVNQNVINLAKNPKKYWELQKRAGYISDKQYNKLSLEKGETAENNIVTYNFFNTIYPGYMKDKGGWANVLKRVKIPLTPTVRNPEMSKSKVMYIKEENIGFTYPGQTSINKGKQIIKEVANDGKYIGDGNTITGQSFFNKMEEFFGYDSNSGFIKTVIYENNGKDVLMVKHQHSKADVGMKIYNGDIAVAEVNSSGDIISLQDGSTIDMIMTGDERKIGTGKFNNLTFDIEGSSVGLIKYADGVKESAKYPHQWLNYVPKSLHKEIIESYLQDDGKILKKVDKLFKIGSDPNKVKSLVKDISKMLPDEISPTLNAFVDLDSGFHPVSSKALSTIATRNLIQPALAMSGQDGTSSYLAPNYQNDLAENEIALSMENAKPIIEMYKADVRKKEKKSGKIPVSSEIINNWLNTNPPVKIIAYRYPIPHINGVVYLTVKRVHDKRNVAELHKDVTFRLLEGDYDGDSIIIEFPTEKIKPIYEKFFNSPEYTDSIEGLNMEEYQTKQDVDITNTAQRIQLIDKLTQGSQAISEIANTAAHFNSIKNAIRAVSIKTGDMNFVIYPTNKDITLPSGQKVTAQKALRIYLQAAADNGKYLILSNWNYNVNNLRKQLFQVYSKEAGISGNFYDLVNQARKDKNYSNISFYNKLWAKFNTDIYKLHSVPNSLRNGRADYVEGQRGGRLSLAQYLDKSKEYDTYLKDRKKYLLDRTLAKNKDSSYLEGYLISNVLLPKEGRHVDVREYLAASLHNIDKKYPKVGKIDPYQYDDQSNYAAHQAGLARIAKNELFKDLKSKDAVIGRNYALSLLEDTFKASQYGRSQFLPMTWNEASWIQPVVNKYSKKFQNLTPKQQYYATYSYLNNIIHPSWVEKWKGTVSFGKLSITDKLSSLPPAISPKAKGLNLLNHKVLKAYFQDFNKSLINYNLKDQIENTQSRKEIIKLCR